MGQTAQTNLKRGRTPLKTMRQSSWEHTQHLSPLYFFVQNYTQTWRFRSLSPALVLNKWLVINHVNNLIHKLPSEFVLQLILQDVKKMSFSLPAQPPSLLVQLTGIPRTPTTSPSSENINPRQELPLGAQVITFSGRQHSCNRWPADIQITGST